MRKIKCDKHPNAIVIETQNSTLCLVCLDNAMKSIKLAFESIANTISKAMEPVAKICQEKEITPETLIELLKSGRIDELFEGEKKE